MFMGWKTLILLKCLGSEIDKLTLKFMWKCEGLRIAKNHLKEEKSHSTHFLMSKLSDQGSQCKS